MAAFDAEISGSDLYVFGDVDVTWLACRMITLGHGARPIEDTDPDHVLRAGWISLGAEWIDENNDPLNYWRQPIYLDFLETFWTPNPSTTHSAYDGRLRCSRVRWHLPTNGVAWLYINT